MQVIRILVYEGEKDWVEISLSSKHRMVNGIYKTDKGSIKEFYIQSPLNLPSDCPFDFKEEEKK